MKQGRFRQHGKVTMSTGQTLRSAVVHTWALQAMRVRSMGVVVQTLAVGRHTTSAWAIVHAVQVPAVDRWTMHLPLPGSIHAAYAVLGMNYDLAPRLLHRDGRLLLRSARSALHPCHCYGSLLCCWSVPADVPVHAREPWHSCSLVVPARVSANQSVDHLRRAAGQTTWTWTSCWYADHRLLCCCHTRASRPSKSVWHRQTPCSVRPALAAVEGVRQHTMPPSDPAKQSKPCLVHVDGLPCKATEQ